MNSYYRRNDMKYMKYIATCFIYTLKTSSKFHVKLKSPQRYMIQDIKYHNVNMISL